MTDERLAELDAAYAKQAGTPFGENWIHLNTAAKHHIFAAYPDLRAHIEAQAATIARQDEALNIAHTAFADCDQSNPMLVEAVVIIRAALTGAARKPDANPFVGTNWQVRADTPTPATEEREAAFNAAIIGLNWDKNPALVANARQLFGNSLNNSCGALSDYMAGRFIDAFRAAAAALSALAPVRAQEIAAARAEEQGYRHTQVAALKQVHAAEILAAEASERARWADWARVRSALNHRWAAEGEHLRTERIALSSAYAELADAIERNEHGAGK